MNSECQWKKKTEQQGKRKKSVSAVEKGRLGGVIKRKLTGYKQQKASKTTGADRQNRLRIPISYNSGRRIHSTGSDPVYHTNPFCSLHQSFVFPRYKKEESFHFPSLICALRLICFCSVRFLQYSLPKFVWPSKVLQYSVVQKNKQKPPKKGDF